MGDVYHEPVLEYYGHFVDQRVYRYKNRKFAVQIFTFNSSLFTFIIFVQNRSQPVIRQIHYRDRSEAKNEAKNVVKQIYMEESENIPPLKDD